ncbi:hypothetical protein O4H61_20525 [Roseovarius aestuarii]|nr:hypothetical protein [Roseovarius aestuarii]
MGKVPFHFPEVETEFMKGFAEAIGENARILRERYMAPDNVLKFSHGRTWEAPANALGDTTGEIKQHGTETELNLKDIAAGKVETVFLAVSQVTDDMNSQMERLLFETMSNSTKKSGQVVDGSQKTFPESMYEMLEMMELPLDDDGELSMPTMFIHPSQSAKLEAQVKSAGIEFDEKFSALKERKKFEAQERERQRLARFERPET